MHTNVNWNDPLTWLTAVGLLLVGLIQGWFIIRNSRLSPRRKWLRAGLNGLLWLLLVTYFVQLSWQTDRPATHALLIGDDVPAAVAGHLSDSLRIRERFTARTLKVDYDSVTLVGQAFSAQTLARLSGSVVQWIPYQQPNQLQTLGWKGAVRLGEMQRVTGRIQSSRKQLLSIRYGGRTLDSLLLPIGERTFALRFPAFVQGRTRAELLLGNTLLDTIRFLARPTKPLTVQFLLNNPDFESKTLAEWLGRRGHAVQLSATLSKNMSSSVRINRPVKWGNKSPDLLVTEPLNAGSALVRRSVADGRSVLFVNLTNAEADCRRINQALGTRWQVRKIANEPVITLSNGLNALPYRFTDALNQFPVAGYPVAVQRTAGRVGVSLLSETFPLALSGDSINYSRIWAAVLAQLSVTDTANVEVEAPIYRGLSKAIRLNNVPGRPTLVRTHADTLRLAYSPLNDHSAKGLLIPRQPGWQSIQDSVALYVSSASLGNGVANRQRISRYMLAQAWHQPAIDRTTRLIRAELPGWAWLLLFVVCFTALWIEPKIY